MSPDLYLGEEEAAALEAIRLLGAEQGRPSPTGRLYGPPRKLYHAAVGAARRLQAAGEPLSERDRILAAAPLPWWIDMYSAWSPLIEAAGLEPTWSRSAKNGAPIVAEGKSATEADYIQQEDYHPEAPPMTRTQKRVCATLRTGGRTLEGRVDLDAEDRIIHATQTPVAWRGEPITVNVRTVEVWSLR